MSSILHILLSCVLLVAATSSVCNGLSVGTVNVTKYSKLDNVNQSSLYKVDLPYDSGYEYLPLLIHLVGSRQDIGYAYGYMLSNEIQTAYHSLMTWLLQDYSFLHEFVELALDWQWDKYLSKQVDPRYMQELAGLAEGAKVKGCDLCGLYITRTIVLSNLPSDAKDIMHILFREFNKTKMAADVELKESSHHKGLLCSMFAAWGSRTVNGKLFSSRNLDWNPDTGVNLHKIVMVTVPNDGGHPSASIGFVGNYGTLAGMSSNGLTVHEANLEVDQESFLGFPWTLRLRYIMEFATDITSARKLWESTNNTVGYNHMITSGKDASDYVKNGGHSTVALAMETMYQYTAYFHDNDPREADALYAPSDGSAPVHIGYPLTEALWRTNHGYDPVIRQHFKWSQSPSSWSAQRYMFIHDAIEFYERSKVKIDVIEAINITAIAGDKGSQPYRCQDNTNGTNILSVVYQPQDKILYAAWERSKGQSWRPAVCSKYVMFNLTEWFTAKPPPS